MIAGKPATCAHLSAPGTRQDDGRAVVFSGQLIADAPHWRETFQILWDIAGCSGAR